MQDTLIILNPAARSERAKGTLKEIEKLPRATMRVTKKAGDARELAAWAVANGFRTVVAAGGDGTINEVVNGLAGSDVALGVLPVGTMNVFAAELGLPGDLKGAWQVIREGFTRRIDLARANDHYFVQLAGVGLDAQALEMTTWEAKRQLGPLSYLVSAAQIAARKPPKLTVEAEGEKREGSFVLVGNGRYYGTKLAFFKDAKLNDGKLDVLIFKNLSYLDIARYFGTILMGIHTEQGDVEYFQTKRAVVRCEEHVPVEVDGDLAGQTPVTFRISSRKLRVFVPEPKGGNDE
jgi:YegS/Rv2252/BmrU family lipid kinase